MSLALPYNQQQVQFVGVEPLAVSGMQNMTNNRLHSNGDRVLYPTFVNIGRKDELTGDEVVLFRLRFKALTTIQSPKFTSTGLLVDRQLNAVEF